ncbi:MAG: 6-phosphofructokinase [bacterium]|nr:6-phosphofructokinase [bacterium]
MSKRIFILTGGGLAPALNPTLYGVISEARQNGFSALGGLFGWASLLDNGHFLDLKNFDIEVIKNGGGTFLRSSRTNPLLIPDGLEQIKGKIKELKIDAIVAVGGDDTLNTARILNKEGLPVVGIPKTIDNDLSGTYFTPGFPSAAARLAGFCQEIKNDAAYALSRIFVIEALGMKAGWLTCSAIYGGADVILPPEAKVNLPYVLQKINQRYEKNGNFGVIVISQEAHFEEPLEVRAEQQTHDQYGHKRQSFICLALKEHIRSELGIETKALYPGNLLETGQPITLDKNLAIELGKKAIQLVKENAFGLMPCIKRENNSQKLFIDTVPLDEAAGDGKYRALPQEYFDNQELLPNQNFLDYMEPILGKYQPEQDRRLITNF